MMHQIIEDLKEIKGRVCEGISAREVLEQELVKAGEKEAIDKSKKKSNGSCVICGVFTDGIQEFTCGHPQCKQELKTRLSERDGLLRLLDADSFSEAKETMDTIRTLVSGIAELQE